MTGLVEVYWILLVYENTQGVTSKTCNVQITWWGYHMVGIALNA